MSKGEGMGKRRLLRKAAFFGLLALLLTFTACDWFRDFDFERGARLTGGDPERGRKNLMMRSCGSCHFIPGVYRASGNKAPSLAGWSAHRKFLDGKYENTPENIEKWLAKPSHRKPGTSMPDMNLTPEESRDMTAYLFSIN